MSELLPATGAYNAAVIEALRQVSNDLGAMRKEAADEAQATQTRLDLLAEQLRTTQRIVNDNAQRQIETEQKLRVLEAERASPLVPPLYWIAGGVCATAFVLAVGFLGLFLVFARAMELLA